MWQHRNAESLNSIYIYNVEKKWLTLSAIAKRLIFWFSHSSTLLSNTAPEQFGFTQWKALRTMSDRLTSEQPVHWQWNAYSSFRKLWRSLQSHNPTCKTELYLYIEPLNKVFIQQTWLLKDSDETNLFSMFWFIYFFMLRGNDQKPYVVEIQFL